MYDVFLYVVNLWDIAESRAWEPKIIPRYHKSSALVLTSVSQRWSNFVISSSRLWSYLLVDTDDEDALEYLQLFLHLSHNCRLFIVLHGGAVVCDDIVMDLLRVGNRIDGLVYESNISRSTLAKFGCYLREPYSQLQSWYKLEVQSVTQPQHRMDYYSFPTSIHSLWMDGLFPLPKLVTLSHFQYLSSLSVKIGLDSGLYLVHEPRLELPNLERLRLQMGFTTDQRVDRSTLIICRNLKVLNLRYALEYDLGRPLDNPATWMEFDIIDALQELQIQLEIDVVNNLHPQQDTWFRQLSPEYGSTFGGMRQLPPEMPPENDSSWFGSMRRRVQEWLAPPLASSPPPPPLEPPLQQWLEQWPLQWLEPQLLQWLRPQLQQGRQARQGQQGRQGQQVQGVWYRLHDHLYSMQMW